MTDSIATMTSQAEAAVRRHAARNFWLNVLDSGTFYLGLSMCRVSPCCRSLSSVFRLIAGCKG